MRPVRPTHTWNARSNTLTHFRPTVPRASAAGLACWLGRQKKHIVLARTDGP